MNLIPKRKRKLKFNKVLDSNIHLCGTLELLIKFYRKRIKAIKASVAQEIKN